MNHLHNRGIRVLKYILNNEVSEDYLNLIYQNGIKYKKVPFQIHQQNVIEKAISIFNDHFQAITVGVNNTFPLHLWDHLLSQAESMLNMMSPTNIVPKISIYASMHRQHDFKKKPLAPMRCTVLLHNKPDIRKTWNTHAIKGYYI